MSTSSTAGRLVAAGAYLPAHRLSRSLLGASGTRAVANYDEDTTSLAVEAGRSALATFAGSRIRNLFLATTAPAYADKTNATVAHAALGLAPNCSANDVIGSVHAGVTAIRAAAALGAQGQASMALLADIRSGLPGSLDEQAGVDGAVALVFDSTGPALAELVGHASATAEFLDRWKIPGEPNARLWEDRFAEGIYASLAQDALKDALASAGAEPDAIEHLIVTGTNLRAVAAATRSLGIAPARVAPDHGESIGVIGIAHAGLLLVDVLERARPGQLIALMVLSDGADCLLFRAGDGLANRKGTLKEQLAGRMPVDYQDFLVWRGMLRRDPPRRPLPDRPAAPPSYRNARWKFEFAASRCLKCGTRHLPPARVCLRCHSVDQMAVDPLSDVNGTITTFAIDHLAYSVAPPVVAAVVDLDGGGRLQCQLTDCDPDSVAVGDRIRLTFRRLYSTIDGVHNYFWKATPLAKEK